MLGLLQGWEVLSIQNTQRVVVVSETLDMCPTSFPKKKARIPHNNHVTKEKANKCEKVGEHKCK